MKHHRLVGSFLILCALTLAACAQLGLPTAETCNQKVAVAYASVTQTRTTALQLLQAKKISAEDAQNIQTQADTARAGVDISRKLCGTDPAAADNRLTAAVTILQALSTYLATRGGA